MKSFDKENELVAGIDIGGTNTKYGLITRRGAIVAAGSVPTGSYGSVEQYVSALYSLIQAALNKLDKSYVLKGVGVGAPCANYYTGTIEYAPNLPWKGVLKMAEIFATQFRVPCVLANDANAAAVGEMMYGAAKGLSDFLIITLGTGVGGGIVSNGKVVYGHDGYAGELGHTVVRPGGRMHWGTGKRGVLEAYCSATGIAITAKKMRAENPASLLNDIPEENIDAKVVHDVAQKGDATAIEVFSYTGQILGEALAGFVTFSSPQAIVLFGGVIKCGDYLMKSTKEYMEMNLLPIYQNKVKLLFSNLVEADAAVLGSGALVWEYLQA